MIQAGSVVPYYMSQEDAEAIILKTAKEVIVDLRELGDYEISMHNVPYDVTICNEFDEELCDWSPIYVKVVNED